MMYFRAKTDDLVNGAHVVAVEGALHSGQNRIMHLLHSSRVGKKELDISNEDTKKDLSDLLACLVASYLVNGQLDTDYFLRNCMRSCRDIIFSFGFRAENEALAMRAIEEYEHINSIVFGYQDERALRRRIDAFVHVAKKIGQTQKVIFSGAYSAATAIRIPDEATEMRNMFDSECKRQKEFDPRNIRFEKESASKDTIANLKNCVYGQFLASGSGVKSKQTLVLISSTFHLIRISEQVMDILKTADNPLLKNVTEIFLVGAEDELLSLKVTDQEYVKNMMFDIFRKELS